MKQFIIYVHRSADPRIPVGTILAGKAFNSLKEADKYYETCFDSPKWEVPDINVSFIQIDVRE